MSRGLALPEALRVGGSMALLAPRKLQRLEDTDVLGVSLTGTEPNVAHLANLGHSVSWFVRKVMWRDEAGGKDRVRRPPLATTPRQR